MPIPADMEQVPVIIETEYIKMIDRITEQQRSVSTAVRGRLSRSRTARNLIIEALRCRGIVQDDTPESQNIAA